LLYNFPIAALLTVKNDEFWEGVPEMKFGGLPSLQDSVTVVGYPIGGDTISVTSGVVSRIEVTPYAHGATELLGVQVCRCSYFAVKQSATPMSLFCFSNNWSSCV
jgi:hypothetical protein